MKHSMRSMFRTRSVGIAAALIVSLESPTLTDARSANVPPSAIQSPDDMASESRGGTLAPSEMSGNSGKTRAQVRQELEQAQKSGELNRINEFYGLPRW
ncbi:DUF4148 domain-containing protein [Paraburkholderia azotifigens]|uniref:DUF4148 domain-containing protein n=1 Tax=Paraburkholderia azotifigens TaxID=2057004 RepID=UPI00316C98DF